MSKRNIELQKEFDNYKDWAEKIIKGLVKQIELKNKEIEKLEMMMDRWKPKSSIMENGAYAILQMKNLTEF